MLNDRHRVDRALTTAEPHDFCGTDTAGRLSSWLSVLDLQVELLLPLEITMFEARPGWKRARSVLDVGCGNGRYLAELSRRFPDKRCVGLETSPEFVSAARAQAPWLDLVEADYFSYRPDLRFDVVLLRFVVQHLEDWNAVLDQARTLLAPGGSLLIVEPDITAFANSPDLPAFERMLKSYGEEAKTRGRLRANLDELPRLAVEREWRLASETRDALISVDPGPLARVLALYRGWAALCQECGYVDADYADVERELSVWSGDLNARSTIGLQWIELTSAN